MIKNLSSRLVLPSRFSLVFIITFGFLLVPVLSYAAPRTTPFSIGQTIDPGAELTEPCGPTDTNCFVAVLATSDEGTTLTSNTLRFNFVGNGVTATESGGTVTVSVGGLTSLNNGKIYIGNIANLPTEQTLSGDAAISNTGVLTIANNAITSAKIVDGTIVLADLASNSVDTSKIVDASVTNAKLANNTIGLTLNTTGADIAVSGSPATLGGAITISIPTASASVRGALSSADWTTFNNKENAITAGTTGQYYRGDKTFQTLDTLAVVENGNLYYTNARFNTQFGTKNTDNLSEGSVNLYFTDTRAKNAIASAMSGDATITGAGVITIANNAVTTAKINDLSITTNKLAANAVTLAKLASDSVDSSKIIDGEVMTADIANLNVTTAKINDLAVTTTKLADDAVTTIKILNSAITSNKILDDAVVTSKISDLNVTTSKINNLAITVAKLADDAVETIKIKDLNITTAKLADLSITAGKLATDAVTTLKIADGSVTLAKLSNDSVDSSKIINDSIVNADINSVANIALSKLANGNNIITSLATPTGSNANGGSISSNTLTLSFADGVNPGLVSTGAQTFAGAKTFSLNPTFSATNAGSILFAGASGLVSENNGNLFWDNTSTSLGIGTNTPTQKLDVAGNIRLQNNLYFDENVGNGLVGLDAGGLQRALRLTSGNGGVGTDGTQGAAIDLYANNATDPNGRAGTLNLFAGTSGSGWINGLTFNGVDSTTKANFQINPQGQVGIGTHDYVLQNGDLPNNFQVNGTTTNLPNPKLTVYGNINNTLENTNSLLNTGIQRVGDVLNFGKDTVAISTSGHFIYMADFGSAELLTTDMNVNPTTTNTPEAIARTSLPVQPLAIKASGKYVYTASASEFQVTDVGNPNIQTVVSNRNISATNAKSLEVYGKYAFVAGDNHIVSVVSLVDPTRASEITTIPTGGGLTDMKIQGKYMYVVTPNNIETFDISNPLNAASLGNSSVGQTEEIVVAGRYIYGISQGSREVQVLDTQNPAAINQIGVLNLDNRPEAITTSGRYLYIPTDNKMFVIIDVENPNNPLLVKNINSLDAKNVAIHGKKLILTGRSETAVYDIPGIESSNALVHSLSTGSLNVLNDIEAYGKTTLNGSLNIGTGGILSAGDVGISGRLDIGGNPSNSELTINGDAGSVGQVLTSGGLGARPTWSNLPSSANYFTQNGNSFGGLATLGTTDGSDLRFITSNSERARFTSNGELLINTTTNSLNSQFVLNAATGKDTGLNIVGNAGSFFQNNIQNTSSAAGASSDYVATANNGSATTNYVDFGINNSGGGMAPFSTAGEGYLYASDSTMNIGALGTTGAIKLFATGGTSSPFQIANLGKTAATFTSAATTANAYTFTTNSLTSGNALQVIGTGAYTGTGFVDITNNTSTAGKLLNISGTALLSASGAGINLSTNAAPGIISNTSGHDLTTPAGNTLSIASGTTGSATFDSGTTGGVNIGTSANAKTVTIGNNTGTSNLAMITGTGGSTLTSTTVSGNVLGITADSITSGKGLILSSTATALTGNLEEINLTGNNATNSGNLLSINSTGTNSLAKGLNITTSGSKGVAALFSGAIAEVSTSYAPAGTSNNANFGNFGVVRLTTASQVINGIDDLLGLGTGLAHVNGRRLTIINAGTTTATLSNQSTSAAAANRIITGTGADLTIPVDASVNLIYDGTTGRWRVIGGSGGSTNASVTLGNFATGGVVGTALATVDIANNLNIAQTTTLQTLTLPNPTTTTAGKLITVSNTGTNSFTMYGATVLAGTYSNAFVWTGTAWQPLNAASNVAAENGETIIPNNTTVNTTLADVAGSSFTLPSAGTYDVEYILYGSMATSTQQSYFGMYDGSNVLVSNSLANNWFAVFGAPGVNNVKQTVRITTTGAATYKLKGQTAANVVTLYSGAAQGTSTGTSKITWKKISGNTPVSGESVDYNYSYKNGDQISVGSNTDITFTTHTGNIPNTTGVYTLIAGKTYELEGVLNGSTFSNTTGGFIVANWVDSVSNIVLTNATAATIVPPTYTSTENISAVTKLTYTPVTNQTVKVRVVAANGTATIVGGRSFISIKQLGSTASTGVSFNSLTNAIASGALDNTTFGQTWNWNGLTTGTGLAMSSNSLTTGSMLDIVNTNASINSTNGLLRVFNNTASTTGTVARIQSNTTAGSGLTVLANGSTLIGTAAMDSSFVAGQTLLGVVGNTNNYLEANIRNLSTGNTAQSGYTATADNGTASTGFMWMGINNSGFTATGATNVGAAGDANILALGNDLYIANGTAAKSLIFMTGGTTAVTNERMRITGTGLVGIGTNAPVGNLHIKGNSAITQNILALQHTSDNTATSGFDIQSIGAGGVITGGMRYTNPSTNVTNLVFSNFNGSTRTDRMGIYGTTGNVGIGTSTPNASLSFGNSLVNSKLKIWDGGATSGFGFGVQNANFRIHTNGTGDSINFYSNEADLTAKANINMLTGAYTPLSDRRAKENINTLTSNKGLAAILGLNPVSYTMIGDSNNTPQVGFIAQEVELILPEIVSTDSGIDGYKRMNYSGLTPVLAKAIQELNFKVEGGFSKMTQTEIDHYTTAGTLTNYIDAIKNEAPRDVVTYLTEKINQGFKPLENFFANRITVIRGYFVELYTNRSHQKELCIGDAQNGGETCITKSQLDSLLHSQNIQPVESPIVIPSTTGDTTVPQVPPLTCTLPQVLDQAGTSCIDLAPEPTPNPEPQNPPVDTPPTE